MTRSEAAALLGSLGLNLLIVWTLGAALSRAPVVEERIEVDLGPAAPREERLRAPAPPRPVAAPAPPEAQPPPPEPVSRPERIEPPPAPAPAAPLPVAEVPPEGPRDLPRVSVPLAVAPAPQAPAPRLPRPPALVGRAAPRVEAPDARELPALPGAPPVAVHGGPPGPAGGAAPQGAPGATDVLRAYLAGVRARIEGAKRYPRWARRRGIEGEVAVRFRIGPGGELLGAEVTRSSGMDVLDRAAVEAVEAAAPFPPVPDAAGRAPLPVEVRLAFVLRGRHR